MKMLQKETYGMIEEDFVWQNVNVFNKQNFITETAETFLNRGSLREILSNIFSFLSLNF